MPPTIYALSEAKGMVVTMIGDILSAIIQLGVFTLIPFLYWLISARNKESFFTWIGLIKPKPENRALLFILLVGFAFVWYVSLILLVSIPIMWWFTGNKENFIDWLGLKTITTQYKPASLIFLGVLLLGNYGAFDVFFTLGDVGSIITETDGFIQGELYGTGVVGLVSAFSMAFIQTGLSEEILFRGFIGKRASAKMGFIAGNLLQGILFGLVHGIPAFFFTGNLMLATWATIATGIAGMLLGYLMKVSGGSIILCWLVHALGNFIPAVIEAFTL